MKHLVASVALVVQIAGCACERHVQVSAAVDRYDHNRTTKLTSPILNASRPFKLPATAYTPLGHELFRHIQVAGTATRANDLPEVLLVPTFSGVRLPLSSEKQSAESSDLTDLIDYLSAGAGTRAGVSVPDLTGDQKATEKQFAELLQFLGDPKLLCTDQASLLAWAKDHDYPATLDVVDARYNLSAFQSVVAVWHGGFWFILYQLPDRNGPTECDPYLRLVVVPGARDGQNYPEKRPS